MTNHEVIYSFRIGTKRSWQNLVKFLKRNLNCIRLYLTRAKNGNFKVITHEQGVLTSFLRLDSLEFKVITHEQGVLTSFLRLDSLELTSVQFS
jgi:hypothetical protein